MKFSIIVPCYNVARYIDQTLDTVVSQEDVSYEILCVNDGSVDATKDMLEEYLQRHCRSVEVSESVISPLGEEDWEPELPKQILYGELGQNRKLIVIHQKNQGVSGARNTAMSIATGDWLVFLDGDDLLAPRALSTLMGCLKVYPNADVIHCGYVQFEDGTSCHWDDGIKSLQLVDITHEIPRYLFTFCFQRMVFRRGLVKNIAWKGVSCTEEMPYVMRCLIRARNLVVCSSVIYGYRFVDGSMSHREPSLKRCNDFFDSTRCITRIIFEGDKAWPQSVVRTTINRWLEGQVSTILKLRSKKDQILAFRYWHEKLPHLRRFRPLCSPWQLLVLAICMKFRFRPVALTLCYFPHWLKAHGVHRR